MSQEYKILGIRHHGPGSARRVARALARWEPDCLLLEAPPESLNALLEAGLPGLDPPVALVLYDEADLRRSVYLPFAHFSPEWQALQWALQARIAIRAIDKPIAFHFSTPDHADPTEATPGSTAAMTDPLRQLALVAGYADTESWWDAFFEQEGDDLDVFEAGMLLMQQLRTAAADLESPENLQREAFMRQAIRQAQKDGYARIAVVCGAWHAPALREEMLTKTSADKQLTASLSKPRTKIRSAWIPWSYPRLALQSGYGAGILSPAWYELRFEQAEAAVLHFLSRASRLLREQGHDNSPAHVTEAVHLATALAALRNLPSPNLAEARMAALSVLCEGIQPRFALIEEKLITGSRIGNVPAEAAVVPLQRALTDSLKAVRLANYWGKPEECWLKATAANPRGGIDLREAIDLEKSYLLHRLRILSIPWGKPQAAEENALGSFRELWRLHWQPEFSIKIVEAAMWGNTLPAAAAACLQQQLAAASSLADMVDLLQQSLLAGLPAITETLSRQLQHKASLTTDIPNLLACLPGLVNSIQYGDVRHSDVTALALLVKELTPGIALGLPAAARQIDDDAARILASQLLAADRALNILQLEDLQQLWAAALSQLARLPITHPLLRGLATRLLFDRQQLRIDDVARHMSFALSAATAELEKAAWLEGFLPGSALLLLHHTDLWSLLDNWIASLSAEDFQHVLPIVRRTFARFSVPERQQLFDLARQQHTHWAQPPAAALASPRLPPSATETILHGLRQWLGTVSRR